MIKKVIALIILTFSSIWAGFSIGHTIGQGESLLNNIAEYTIQLIVAISDCIYILISDRHESLKNKQRKDLFDADRKLFHEILGIIPEDTMIDLSISTAETSISKNIMNRIFQFADTYPKHITKSFHNRKIQSAYEQFCRSLDIYLNFTSYHLFPIEHSHNFTLRQMTKNGIENNSKEFKKITNDYYRLCDIMIRQYQLFIKCGRRELAC